MICTTSNKEIQRRIKAFTTLIISFLIFAVIFSIKYIIQYINIFIFVIVIVGLLLFVSRIIVAKYLNSLKKINIELTSKYFIRNNTKYLIKDISKIIIKNNTSGFIRSIKIDLINKLSLCINNSTNNIEEFSVKLQSYLPKSVIKKTIKEPINFDHPLFYYFLGIVLSFLSVEAIKLLFNLSLAHRNLINYGVLFLHFF